MDKSWMTCHVYEKSFHEGVLQFLKFAEDNQYNPDGLYRCPCRRCLNNMIMDKHKIYYHLTSNSISPLYIVWDLHGEVTNIPTTSDERMKYLYNRASSSNSIDPAVQFVHDAFPFHEQYFHDEEQVTPNPDLDDIGIAATKKYDNLIQATKTPLYHGSLKTTLGALLEVMSLKERKGMNDSTFTEVVDLCKRTLPEPNTYPESYAAAKRALKDVGMGYEVFDACVNSCHLYYKEGDIFDQCPVCGTLRYMKNDGKKIPRKQVRYFPLTPRLQRLYMSQKTACEMRWHGQREKDPNDDVLRHPADGEAWKDFDRSYPHFACDDRNVRLALSTDGFNPFSSNAVPYSCWPIVAIPYNLPPSLCMNKEFNMLTMIISGPKSPGKCLNTLMRPLIDELKVLWDTGVAKYDRVAQAPFMMKVAVMWTISDFSGLGMLGGIQTKGYKACPICVDEIDATFNQGRMSYLGARRWLSEDHPFRYEGGRFNGGDETRQTPKILSGHEVPKEKFCWTHVSIFWELPYWKKSKVRHALDVMHIEKNVCDNVIGTLLGIDGKTKDDIKARKTLQEMGIRRHLWQKKGDKKFPKASYVVKPQFRSHVLDQIAAVRYPSGYAGSLKNKVRIEDKKFYGLKTHDCHVLLQRILPVVIRPYVAKHVADALCDLSRFFQMLCSRELKKSHIKKMEEDIVLILCKLEAIFPPAFFTIMVHLCIHLPQQVLLIGPVHYTWMFPIERDLGEYKKSVRNKRYPECCIAERYVMHECVTFINLYMNNVSSNNNDLMHVSPTFDISVVSDNVRNLTGWVTHLGLSKPELETAHWLVMENCVEVQPYMNRHKWMFETQCPNGDLAGRIESFNDMFRKKMNALGTQAQRELRILSLKPLATRTYLQCIVNGVKWVSEERDHKRTTQNSGVMVVTDDETYYGILVEVVELLYEQGMSVVLFRCRWYDETTIEMDRGLISVDTNTDCHKLDPFCLALHARQVFYIVDPVQGDGWKVVNHMFHRGMYNERTLARNTNVGPVYDVEEPYQEPVTIPICNIFIDLGPIPFINIPSDEDESGEDYNAEENEDEFEDGYSDVDNINNEIYDSDNDDNDDNGNDDFDPEY